MEGPDEYLKFRGCWPDPPRKTYATLVQFRGFRLQDRSGDKTVLFQAQSHNVYDFQMMACEDSLQDTPIDHVKCYIRYVFCFNYCLPNP